ncbi:MAG: hypothetical protein ABSG82_09660 [Sedimentisphaerales bacterium]|jgi:hypothetical protein
MDKAISGKAKRLEALIQQLSRYDARYIQQLKSAQSLAEDISIKLLTSGMMPKLSKKTIKKKILIFLIHKQTGSHGRMISAEEAEKCGLNIKKIALDSDLWRNLWELYLRADWAVSHQHKLLESSTCGLRS